MFVEIALASLVITSIFFSFAFFAYQARQQIKTAKWMQQELYRAHYNQTEKKQTCRSPQYTSPPIFKQSLKSQTLENPIDEKTRFFPTTQFHIDLEGDKLHWLLAFKVFFRPSTKKTGSLSECPTEHHAP